MRRRWERRLAREHDELVVALDRGAVVGLALHGPSGDEPPLPGTELRSLYVARHWYGRGLAAQLVRRALGARPASLWVFEGNTRARAFYLREGWTATVTPASSRARGSSRCGWSATDRLAIMQSRHSGQGDGGDRDS